MSERRSSMLSYLAVLILSAALSVACAQALAQPDAPRHSVEGALVNAAGEPLGLQQVVLVGSGDSEGQGGVDVTGPDGSFAVQVPDGDYHVRIVTRLGNECTVSGYEGPASSWQAIVAVRGEGIRGLLVTVAGEPADTPALLGCAFPPEDLEQIQGTVTDPQGEPVAGVRVAVSRYANAGSSPSLADGYDSDWTEADGGFRLRLQPGAYLLHVLAGGQTCSVSRQDVPADRGRAVLETGEGDIRGLRIVVAGTETDTRVWSACSFSYSVTNELRPGWNLTGWLGAETGVDTLFEQISALALVYAWDPDKQEFLPAFRLGGRLVGKLKLLTSGMGLQLYLTGTERVTWTQDAVDEALLRSKVLRPGWNLVTWMGLDGVPLAAAVGDLGDSYIAAAGWDIDTQRFVSLGSDDSDSTDRPVVSRGEAFWVHSSTWRQWWQHGDARELVLLGDVPPDRRTQIRDLIDDTEAFFEAEFGLAAPHITVYIAASQADLGAEFLDATGGPVSATACAARGRNYILLYCQGDLSWIYPQEHFHVLQSDSTARVESPDLGIARWLVDGTAAHAAARYRDARAIESYADYLDSVIARARTENGPLSDPAAIGLRRLAVDLLVQRAGEQSFVDFWRQLDAADDWLQAFQQVFGLPLEEFLELFDAHRAEVAPPAS